MCRYVRQATPPVSTPACIKTTCSAGSATDASLVSAMVRLTPEWAANSATVSALVPEAVMPITVRSGDGGNVASTDAISATAAMPCRRNRRAARRRRTTTNPSRSARSVRADVRPRREVVEQREQRGRLRFEIGEEGGRVHDAEPTCQSQALANGEQSGQRRVGDVTPVRKVLDRVRVFVEFLGDAKRQQQIVVDDVHGRIASSAAATAAAVNRSTSTARSGRRRLTTTAPTCTIDCTIDATSRNGDCGRDLSSRSCSGLPSKSVSSIVVAGTQELPGMEVSVNAMTRHLACVAERLQHGSDSSFVEPVQSVKPAGRQAHVGHRLIGDRAECDRRRLHVGERTVEPSRDRTHPSRGADEPIEVQPVVEPGLDIVDVPIPAVQRAGQERRHDRMHDAIAFVDANERRHLIETGGHKMANQLHARDAARAPEGRAT